MIKNPIVVDTDPGIDDAVALAIAFTNTQLNLKLVTSVSGNVNIDRATDNTLKLAEFFNHPVPVAKGAGEPLMAERVDAAHIHGEDGLGGHVLPDPEKQLLSKHAVEAMRDVILSEEDKTIVLAIGPLTNVALLLKMYPETIERIERIICMGGSFKGGNATGAAEFNIYADPHAAEIVLRSTVSVTMLGLDVTEKTELTEADIEEIREMGELGGLLQSIFAFRNGSGVGLSMHDSCTFAYLLKPELFQTSPVHVDVVLDGPAMGATVPVFSAETANVDAGIDVDVPKFRAWLINQLWEASKTITRRKEGEKR